jgi:class 3 adenylate cyclase
MDTENAAGQTDSRYLAILAFDIRRFSSFSDTQRTRIATEFRDAIEGAFHETGLSPVWNERVFCQNSGDGMVVGFDHRHLRAIVDHVPLALQHRLKRLFQLTGRGVRMRLGVSVGPVQGINDQRVDIAPNQTVIDACRLGDAPATRMLLEHSDERATFVAVAVSSMVMAAVRSDPSWLQASELVRVPVIMAEKDYQADAYLHVPVPSGALLHFGLANLPDSPRSEGFGDEPLEALMQRGLDEVRPTSHAMSAGGSHVGRDDRSVHGGTSITVGGNVGRNVVGGDLTVRSDEAFGGTANAIDALVIRTQLDEILRAIGAAEEAGQLESAHALAASREVAAARDHADDPGLVLRSLRRCRTYLQEASGLAASVSAIVAAVQGLR